MFNFKQRFNNWQHQRYLKKMGWTQEAYDRQTDPDYNIRGNTISSYYCGYPYVMIIASSTPLANHFGSWLEGVTEIRDWCKANLEGKFREDIVRAYTQTPLGLNGPEDIEYVISDIGGVDILCWAFKDEQDYLWFQLKWGHLG